MQAIYYLQLYREREPTSCACLKGVILIGSQFFADTHDANGIAQL